MVVESKLMGFVRRSRNGGAIKVSIAQDAFDSAQRYRSADGTEYVGMIINLNKLRCLLTGEQEVTAVNQLVGDQNQDNKASS
ncbi:MAG: hypothetical protein ACMUIE_05150 [Thermoplasmatota archaeon]